jgi:hypothetical protein
MNVFETHVEVGRWINGQRQPFYETFNLMREAEEHAERLAAAGNVPILRVKWSERVEDLRPGNAVVIEEVMRRNPRGGDGRRVYSMARDA